VVVLVNGRISAELTAPDIEAARLTELAFSTASTEELVQ
jgi:hypothetical protein